MTSIDEHKRTALIEQLGTGHTVLVAIATRVPGVQIPSHLTAKPTVFLNLGYNMPKPMEGFLTSETGFEVTLSFSGQPFRVRVPWAALDGVKDVGIRWPSAAPTAPAPPRDTGVIDLMSRRTPADRAACLVRLTARATGGDAA